MQCKNTCKPLTTSTINTEIDKPDLHGIKAGTYRMSQNQPAEIRDLRKTKKSPNKQIY